MTNFRLFQNERVCRQQIVICDENGRKLFKRVENIEGKGAISPFPTVFLRLVLQTRKKIRDC